MHLTSQLIPVLVCLLACTSNFIHGHKLVLQEIIETLNFRTVPKDWCMELTVADVLTAPKNTTENEVFCRATMVLRQIYKHHKCLNSRSLRKLDRNLSSMANMTNCPVNKATKITLKNFLERLKSIMQEKYAKS
ncbi:interleukin-4 [Hipposideros larvatus]